MGFTLDSKAFMAAMKESKPFLELLALQDVRGRAQRIAETAKSLAPVGTPEEGDRHPGAMRDDIGLKGEGIDSKGPYVDVGTTEPYGLHMEFGTQHNAPHPFMRPAIAAEAGRSEMSTRINLAPRARQPKK